MRRAGGRPPRPSVLELQRQPCRCVVRSFGKDGALSAALRAAAQRPAWAGSQRTPALAAVVEGWLDLAKLVASEGSKSKSPYEELAYKIGAKRAGLAVQEQLTRRGS